MTNKNFQQIGPSHFDADVLIVGSGLAGILLGILLHDQGASVTVIAKETFSDSNTFYAQGGLAAVTWDNQTDSLSDHLADTVKSGAGLTDELTAKQIIDAAPYLVQKLKQFGMLFDTKADGTFALAREGGHAKARVLHSRDTTGKAISKSLLDTARQKATASTNFKLVEYCFAFHLLTDGQGVTGAEVLHDGVVKQINAHHVVLATGGAGQIFSRTTNPLVATADGAAMAYRAGAALADLEFMQFHPTALCKPGAPAFLISEAVRGAGAILLDGGGEPFVHKFHPDGDLATRDVVARAIHATMLRDSLPFVNLDLRPIGKQILQDRFPNIIETCQRYGIDPLIETIPVCPAAHYFMGGIMADEDGCTTLPGLYAIGEVACTGLHGANRLASNSLLEAGVMAINLARRLNGYAGSTFFSGKLSRGQRASVDSVLLRADHPDAHSHQSNRQPGMIPVSLSNLRNDMYEFASLTRSGEGLATLSHRISANQQSLAALNVANISSANMLLIANLMATAASHRSESRGAHFREDYPLTNDLHFARRQAVSDGNWQWFKPSADYAKIDKQSARTA